MFVYHMPQSLGTLLWGDPRWSCLFERMRLLVECLPGCWAARLIV